MGQQVTVRRVVLDDGTEAEFDGEKLRIGSGESFAVSESDKADLAWLITGRRDGRLSASRADAARTDAPQRGSHRQRHPESEPAGATE